MDHYKRVKRLDRNVELRSEKVRNIVGQIPPALIRYGTIIIIVALLVMLGVFASVPYRKIIAGTVVINNAQVPVNELVTFDVELKLLIETNELFPDKYQIILIAPNYTTEGIISHYHELRTSTGRHKAVLTINIKDVKPIQNSEIDFKLILQETSILKYFWNSIFSNLH